MLDDDPRKIVAKLRRRSNKELYLYLAKRSVAAHTYRKEHWVPQIHARRARGLARYKAGRMSILANIDRPMLDMLGQALRNKPSPKTGQAIFNKLWKRAKDRVCNEWDLCGKWQPNDTTFVLALWTFLTRGQPASDHYALLIFSLIAVRFGPETLCHCSKRQKATATRSDRTMPRKDVLP